MFLIFVSGSVDVSLGIRHTISSFNSCGRHKTNAAVDQHLVISVLGRSEQLSGNVLRSSDELLSAAQTKATIPDTTDVSLGCFSLNGSMFIYSHSRCRFTQLRWGRGHSYQNFTTKNIQTKGFLFFSIRL